MNGNQIPKNEANDLIKENIDSLFSFLKVQFYNEKFQIALFKLEPHNLFEYFWNRFHPGI